MSFSSSACLPRHPASPEIRNQEITTCATPSGLPQWRFRPLRNVNLSFSSRLMHTMNDRFLASPTSAFLSSTVPGSVYPQYIEFFESFDHLLHLLRLFRLARLRNFILREAPNEKDGPESLPVAVSAYLEDRLSIPSDALALLWTELRQYLPILTDTD